jgi:hypothetical protein
MRFDKYSFGSLEIDGSSYEHDVLIDRGEISKRKKKPSKKFREQFGHTPLSVELTIFRMISGPHAQPPCRIAQMHLPKKSSSPPHHLPQNR